MKRSARRASRGKPSLTWTPGIEDVGHAGIDVEFIAAAGRVRDTSIDADDIKITKRGPTFSVDIDYTWPIDLRFHKYEMQFHVSESGEIFEK